MAELALPILLVLFVWWFATGAILYLARLPRATYPWSLLGASLIAVAALAGVRMSSGSTSVASACCGFVCAILIWGWVETGFLLGGITGPRRMACPPECRGFKRFKLAVQTLLYHELTLVIAGGLVILMSFGRPNTVGLWTFLLLWAMRQSAKLNLFFGVPNLFAHLLPRHLSYLASYQRSDRISLFFPVSVVFSATLTVWLAIGIFKDGSAFETIEAALLTTLVGLAVLEHGFLVLPLPSDRLWTWALPSNARKSPAMELSRDGLTALSVPAQPGPVTKLQGRTST